MKYTRKQRIIKKIGKRVRQMRLEQNLSQAQLAFEANLNITQIGRIERGEINTSISQLIVIAQVLNVKLKELVDY